MVKRVSWFASVTVALLVVSSSLFAVPASAGRSGASTTTKTVTVHAARFQPHNGVMTCPTVSPSFCSSPSPGNDVTVRVATGQSFALVTEVKVTAHVHGLDSGAKVLLGSGVVGNTNPHTGRVSWDLSIQNGNYQPDLDLFATNGTVDLFVTPGLPNLVPSVRVLQVSFTVTGQVTHQRHHARVR